jgi:hypothetical protein
MADPNLQPVVIFGAKAAAARLAEGCGDRQATVDFTQAMLFESRVKGFGIGLVLGAAACVAVAIYVKSKGA